jgi:hypothetical protein
MALRRFSCRSAVSTTNLEEDSVAVGIGDSPMILVAAYGVAQLDP